jgi:hypothetical protein
MGVKGSFEEAENNKIPDSAVASIGMYSAADAHCDHATKCYVSWTPSLNAPRFSLYIADYHSMKISGSLSLGDAFAGSNKPNSTVKMDYGKTGVFSINPSSDAVWLPMITSVNGKGGFGSGTDNYALGQNLSTVNQVYLTASNGSITNLTFTIVDSTRINLSIPSLPGDTYTLNVKNPTGLLGSYFVGPLGPTSTTYPAPTCSITLDKNAYNFGDGIRAYYTTTGATYATWVPDRSGKDNIVVSEDKLNPSGYTNFSANVIGNPSLTLRAYSSNGATATCSKTFNVSQMTSTVSSSAITILNPVANMGVTQGQPLTVSWTSISPNSVYSLGYSDSFAKTQIGTYSAADAHCYAASKCYVTWIPNFSASSVIVGVTDSTSGSYGNSGTFAVNAPQSTSPTITVFGNKDYSPASGGFPIIWNTSAPANVSLDVTCPNGDMSFTTSKGNNPTCAKGGVWIWKGATADSITVSSVGNNVPATAQFTLTVLDTNGNYTDQKQTLSITFPAVTQVTAPVITAVSPSQGGLNDLVTLNGTGLAIPGVSNPSIEFHSTSGVLMGTGYFVNFDTITANQISFRPRAIGNGALAAGTYQIRVVTSAGRSNGMPFTITSSLSDTSSTLNLRQIPTETMVLGASASCTEIARNLHRGDESADTTLLQTFLHSVGLLNDVTGFYGDNTVSAVKAYQGSKGLSATGMVYELTRDAIRGESCGD